MNGNNIFLNSLNQSFAALWRNKSKALILFILQILFFGLILFIGIYQVRMIESAKAMSDYLSGQQLDDVTIANKILEQQDILGDNPELIGQSYDSIIRNFRIFLLYFFIAAIAFMSLAWALASRFDANLNSGFWKTFLRNVAILLVSLGLIGAFFLMILNIPFSEAAFQGSKILVKYASFLLFSIIIMYFVFISLSLAWKYGLNEIMIKSLQIGIKKANYIISAYILVFILIILSLYLVFYLIDINFFASTIALISFIFSFVFGRMLVFNIVNRLDKSS